MTYVRRPTRTHEGLSDWLGENVRDYVRRRKDEGWSHEQIAEDLSQSGYHIKAMTVKHWLAPKKRKGVK